MQFISHLKEYKKEFEKEYVIPLTLVNQFYFASIIGIIIGCGVRIYYNGFISVFTTLLFEFGWWGLGWGLTPVFMRLMSILVGGLFGLFSSLYVTNVKRVYYGSKPITLKELLNLAYNDFNNWVYQKLYGRPFDWGEKHD